jgi:hypothetical protein
LSEKIGNLKLFHGKIGRRKRIQSLANVKGVISADREQKGKL